MADQNKIHKYQQNQYVEGYVPEGTSRPITQVTGDIIISNPIIIQQVVQANGVNTFQRITPLNTTTDGDLASNDGININPTPGTNVLVVLNGFLLEPADGASDTTAACYFASPEGVIRLRSEVVLGDLLHWVGSLAGIEVVDTDELILMYQV